MQGWHRKNSQWSRYSFCSSQLLHTRLHRIGWQCPRCRYLTESVREFRQFPFSWCPCRPAVHRNVFPALRWKYGILPFPGGFPRNLRHRCWVRRKGWPVPSRRPWGLLQYLPWMESCCQWWNLWPDSRCQAKCFPLRGTPGVLPVQISDCQYCRMCWASLSPILRLCRSSQCWLSGWDFPGKEWMWNPPGQSSRHRWQRHCHWWQFFFSLRLWQAPFRKSSYWSRCRWCSGQWMMKCLLLP